MLTLEVSNLHWIKGADDDPTDLCAHGTVNLQIGEYVLPGLASLDCTVSAAALYLLRSLSRWHRRGEQEHLFPCCGFAMYDIPEKDDVFICGCPTGIDVDILHESSGIVIHMPDRTIHHVSKPIWRDAVFTFADRVAEFYRSSSPKRPSADDAAGFRKFVQEWSSRRGAPLLDIP